MNTAQKNDIFVIELDGVLDSQTAEDFKQWVKQKLEQGYRAVVLDCQNLRYLSSKGIGAVIEIHKWLNDFQGKLALTRLSLEVKRLLEFLKVTDEVGVFETLESALYQLQPYKKADTSLSSGAKEEAAHKSTADKNVVLANEATLEKNATEYYQKQHEKIDQDELIHIDDDYVPRQNSVEVLPPVESSPAKEKAEEKKEIVEKLPTENAPAENPKENKSPEKPIEKFDDDLVELSLINEEIAEVSLHKSSVAPASTDKQKTLPSPAPKQSLVEEKNAETQAPQQGYHVLVVNCPSCSSPLRVSKPGKYLCPSCRSKFQYPFSNESVA